MLILTLILTCTLVVKAVEINTSEVVDGGWTKFNRSAEAGPCRCVSGSGFRERIWRRTCTKPKPRGGGKKCRGRRKVVRIELCNSSVCNITGEVMWGEWSQFGACSTTCGLGNRTRWRYWNNFDPVKKKKNTQTIPCENPQCPISFSLHGEKYQLISRLEGYKWNIGPGWKFVCNDDQAIPELLKAVEKNNQTHVDMKLIEGTSMFVKQDPLNSGEEAWQYIEVDEPGEEVEILNWEFVPINNSNIIHFQKEICHLLSSPEEAEKMYRGLLKIFRKKSTARLLQNDTNTQNKLSSLQGGLQKDEQFVRKNVKNYRIPTRDLNTRNSRNPFLWRQKGLDPDLQPLQSGLSKRVSLSFTESNNTKKNSSSEDCQCMNGTTLFLASHHLMEQGYGVVSGRTDCPCVNRNTVQDDRPVKITTTNYNDGKISDYITKTTPSTTIAKTSPITTIANATDIYTNNPPLDLPTIANATDIYINSRPQASTTTTNKPPLSTTSKPTHIFTTIETTISPTPCPPPATIEERCAWLTSITKQQQSFHQWDEDGDGDGLLSAEEWMNGRKGKNCISPTEMKYYVDEAIKTIRRFDGDGNKRNATFLEFYAINRGTSHAFDC